MGPKYRATRWSARSFACWSRTARFACWSRTARFACWIHTARFARSRAPLTLLALALRSLCSLSHSAHLLAIAIALRSIHSLAPAIALRSIHSLDLALALALRLLVRSLAPELVEKFDI